MNMSGEVRIAPCESETEDDVFEFLRDNFFPDEPMNCALKRTPKKEDFNPLTYVKSGHSLAAYVKDNDGEERLAGVALNKVKKRDEERVVKRGTPTDEILFNIMGKLEEKTDIWSKVTSDEVFYTVILTIGKAFRGMKIGQKLMEESLRRATADGYTHAIVECSSAFSARIMETLGYERIGEIRYEDYRNDEGEVLMKVQEPHKAIIKYLKKL